MEVFLSWSGKRSQRLALALRDWLPLVVPSTQPWLSSEDIDAGDLWARSLFAALASCDIGVLCLTKDRLKSSWSQWMLFEAGSIAAATRHSPLIPYCLDLPDEPLQGPLSLFQAKKTTKEGTLALVRAIAEASHGDDPRQIDVRFEQHWPTLQKRLSQIPADNSDVVKVEDVLCAYTEQFEQLDVHRDIDALQSAFPSRTKLLPQVRNSELTEALARHRRDFTIVHILADATEDGRLAVGAGIAADDFSRLLDLRRTELVFLASCENIVFGEKLARHRSVITGYGDSHPGNWGPWVARFYEYLAAGDSLYQAYDKAKSVSPLPIILLPRRDCRFSMKARSIGSRDVERTPRSAGPG